VKRVMVLGCGPAGLFAAQTATELGAQVLIYSKYRRSEMFGEQYLHQPIPGLSVRNGFEVTYTLEGSLEEYLRKVYGDEMPDNVTVNSLEGTFPAWDIRQTYAAAWVRFRDRIQPVENINTAWLDRQLLRAGWGGIPDAIISTIPAPALCDAKHDFLVRDVWAIGDAPERGVFAPRLTEPNVIRYNGTKDSGWYRASVIADYAAVEWPVDSAPPLEGVSRVAKPIKTNCDCLQEELGDSLIRIGRYGAWSRFGHSHQAYWVVRERLEKIL
jgi:hypothetical protein